MRTRSQARKEEILSGLVEARECILAAASSLPAERRDDVFLGVWSVKDVLAHLVGWDYTNLEAVKEILAGKFPSFYAHYDRDWRTYNARLVAQYRKDDFAELIQSAEESHRRLIEFLRNIAHRSKSLFMEGGDTVPGREP